MTRPGLLFVVLVLLVLLASNPAEALLAPLLPLPPPRPSPPPPPPPPPLWYGVATSSYQIEPSPPPPPPPPPLWYGVATSSYQIEGAFREGNRGPSIWDTFSHSEGRTARGETGDVASDFYHRYADDIRLAGELGVQKFRLSISWPRIFPNRTLSDDDDRVLEKPNEEGFAFYERVLDALEGEGIEPLVTLYHWDLPQALQDSYGGWTSPKIVEDFRAYSRVVFERLGARRRRRRRRRPGVGGFGDGAPLSPASPSPSSPSPPDFQIRYWTSLNEPWVFCFLGHTTGAHAPGMRSAEAGWACARNALLAHLAAAEEFEKVFGGGGGGGEASDGGGDEERPPLLSVNVPAQWSEPWSDSEMDRALAREALDFDGLGIFADVLFKGQWPESVLLALAAARDSGLLSRAPPPFSKSETAAFLRHRPRYFALNFYTSYWAKPAAEEEGSETIDPSTGLRVRFSKEQVRSAAGPGGEIPKNVSIGLPGAPSWLFSTPWAMRSMLREVNERYGPEEIVVTENGFATRAEQEQQQQQQQGGEPEKGEEEDGAAVLDGDERGSVFEDGDRVAFYREYLAAALDAVALDGVPLHGFCAWSLLDNFEWADGYSMRFGIVRVDFATQARTAKRSALWLRDFFFDSKIF